MLYRLYKEMAELGHYTRRELLQTYFMLSDEEARIICPVVMTLATTTDSPSADLKISVAVAVTAFNKKSPLFNFMPRSAHQVSSIKIQT